MLPRAKTAAHLSGLVGSDSEPDFDDFEPQSVTVARTTNRAMPVAKKARGRPAAANKVTKPAPKTTRRTSGRATAAAQAQDREALADKSNTGTPAATANDPTKSRRKKAQNVDETPVEKPPVKATRGRPKGTKLQPNLNESPVEEQPVPSTRRGRPAVNRNVVNLPEEIPETQMPEDMEIDQELGQTGGIEEVSHASSDSLSGDILPDLEGSDVSIRRRLGDLTRKYDNLERRHRELREIGVKEAERLYERLKKQSQDNDAASKMLIAKLKDEIAAQSTLLKQGEKRQQQLDRSEAKVVDLEEQLVKLNMLLAESKADIKTLSMRLAASRTAEAQAKVPGSAIKAGAAGGRLASSEAVQTALVKEDMYGDLTGLIIRAVRRNGHEDTFDCIQTGRNGTLHFKLVLERPEDSDSYDDSSLTYLPQLDPDRDEEMMEVLPDYLVDEITFPRPQASKFYTRVIKSLNERLE